MKKALLFDLDGTLTDPGEGITKSVQYALEKMGCPEPDRDKLRAFIGPPLLEQFMAYRGFTQEEAAQAVAYYRERFAPIGIFENKIYPGIPELLADLQEQGFRLAVASSKPEIYVEQILEHFGLRKYFDVVTGSGLDGTRTTKEEVVEEALRCLLPENLFREMMETKGRYKYDTVVMVGDRRFDVEGAKEYHIVSVGVTYGYAVQGELAKAGADEIVETVEELAEVLLCRK